jgi:hypothetical protein
MSNLAPVIAGLATLAIAYGVFDLQRARARYLRSLKRLQEAEDRDRAERAYELAERAPAQLALAESEQSSDVHSPNDAPVTSSSPGDKRISYEFADERGRRRTAELDPMSDESIRRFLAAMREERREQPAAR